MAAGKSILQRDNQYLLSNFPRLPLSVFLRTAVGVRLTTDKHIVHSTSHHNISLHGTGGRREEVTTTKRNSSVIRKLWGSFRRGFIFDELVMKSSIVTPRRGNFTDSRGCAAVKRVRPKLSTTTSLPFLLKMKEGAICCLVGRDRLRTHLRPRI